MPAASWFLRKTEPDPVMSKRCSAPGTNLSRTMRRDPAGRIMPGHDLSPPGLRRGTIPAFYRKMQEMQRWHAYSQNTPSWLCFFIYVIILICYINEAMLCTYEKFFDLLFTTWRLRRRGMRLCTQVLPVIAGKFSLLSGINHKKKDGKGCHTFCCLRGGPQAQKGWDKGRRLQDGSTCRRHGDAVIAWLRETIGHKKGRPPHDGRPDVQRRGKAYWPRSTSTGFSSRSSRNLSGRSFWSGTVMSPWTYSR